VVVDQANPRPYDPDADGMEIDYKGESIKVNIQ
jgi:hypothetical protein